MQSNWRQCWFDRVALILAVGVALALLRRRSAGPRAVLLARETAIGLRYGAVAVTSPLKPAGRRLEPPLRLVGYHATRTAAVIYLLLALAAVPFSVLVTIRDLRLLSGSNPIPPFLIAQDGGSLRFEGHIDRTSVAAILQALATMDVSTLRLDSGGGELASASDLAEVVHARGVHVEIDDECRFACTVVLAASPTGTVRPDSIVTLYDGRAPVPLAGRGRPDAQVMVPVIDTGLQRALDRFGIRTPGPARLRVLTKEDHSYPNLNDLDDMSLVMFVRDPDTGRLLRPWEYCRQNSDPRC